MLRLELVLTLITSAAAMSSLVGAAFGMNLTTNLEADPHAFAVVCGSMGMMAAVSVFGGIRYCRRAGLL